jgi:hypothetical protein
LDSILKYLSVISVAGAGIAFVVGLWKYLDQRAREERTKRFELYHDLMRRVSAFGDAGSQGVPLTQQCAAIYELQHFHEYSYASLPILTHLREDYRLRSPDSPDVLFTALDATLHALTEGKNAKCSLPRDA